MVYRILRFLASIACKIYYKNIFIYNKDNIPADRPLFLACNHPNGFTEPILLSCFLDRELYFLVRGDMFDKVWLRPLLVSTNQMPIFRHQDGFSSLRNNVKTFQATTNALHANKAILIFAEGSTEMVKKLRPLKKGMARMIFQAKEKYSDLDPAVIPIGINFTESMGFRTSVHIMIGPAIETRDYFDSYSNNKAKGMDELTAETYRQMKNKIIHVEASREDVHASICNIYRQKKAPPFYPVVMESAAYFEDDQRIAQLIEEMDEGEFELLSEEVKRFTEYKEKKPLSRKPILVFLFLMALPGYIINFIPGYGLTLFARVKASKDVFFSALRLSLGIFLFILYYLFLGILILILAPVYLWLLAAGILGGIIYLYYLYEKSKHLCSFPDTGFPRMKSLLNKI